MKICAQKEKLLNSFERNKCQCIFDAKRKKNIKSRKTEKKILQGNYLFIENRNCKNKRKIGNFLLVNFRRILKYKWKKRKKNRKKILE